MSPIHCAICLLRISDWMMMSGKCLFIKNHLVHKSCAEDYKLKHGKDWGDDKG